MDLGLHGRVALVTGGTRGIGRAVALRLAEEGCTVVATGSSAESVTRARHDLGNDEGRIDLLACDMADAAAVLRLPGTVVEQSARLDIVVNNAARLGYGGNEGSGLEEWENLFHTKLLGYSLLMDASLEVLTHDVGSIVNIAGMAAFVPSPTSPQSAAVNAGIIAMSRGYAARAAQHGIRVNVVTPGATDTDRFQARLTALTEKHDGDAEAARRELVARIPLGRPVPPEEVACLVALLASPVLSSVTGANVLIDAGGTLGRSAF